MLSSFTLAEMIGYATPLWNEIDVLAYIACGAAVAVMILRFGVRYVKSGR